MKNIILKSCFFALLLMTTSCRKDGEGGFSEIFSMSFQNTQAVSVASSKDLLSYLQQNGYYSLQAAKAGTKIYYSTSYETDSKTSSGAEAGQAYGKLVNANGKVMFQQQDNVTTQLLLCPGSSGGFSSSKCLWRFDGADGYLQLMYDVVTASASHRGGSIHPGYKSMSVKKGSFTGGTAGKKVSYDDVIEVALDGGKSKSEIYFAKSVGPVAVEFRESYMPAGTAKVYIDAQAE